MKELRTFGYALASTIGLGVLLLPKLFYEVGIIPALLILGLASIFLGLVSYMAFDLVDHTKKPLDFAVEKYLFFLKPLVPLSIAVFVYGAISSYLVAAGIQMSSWIGGSTHIWASIFFTILFAIIVFSKPKQSPILMVISLFLAFLILYLIPISISLSRFQTIPIGKPDKLTSLFLLSTFALFGFFSAKELLDIAGTKARAERMFSYAYVLSYILYISYAMTVSIVIGNTALLSTASIVKLLKGVYSAVISIGAILAFLTPAIPISFYFINSFQKRFKIGKKSALLLLFFPVAVLYTAADYNLISFEQLVIGLGGGAALLFASLTAFANAELSKEKETTIPKQTSYVLAILLLLPLILYILGF